MKNIISAIILSVLLFLNTAHAQFYSQISSGSDLYCIYQPDGKTQIGRKSSKGIRKISFAAAKDGARKEQNKIKASVKKINQLLQKIRSMSTNEYIHENLKAKDVKAVNKFFFEGEIPILTPTKEEAIAAAERQLASLNAKVAYQSLLITLIAKCQKRDVPSPGKFDIIYSPVRKTNWFAGKQSSAEGYFGVYAVIPYEYVLLKETSFCFEGASGSNRAARFSEYARTNPCYQDELSELPGACDHLFKRNDKNEITHVVALLEDINFYYKEGVPGFETYAEASARLEVYFRNRGWGDTIRFAVNQFVGEGINYCATVPLG